MQNLNNTSYINNKIINIKSEILFREAEDDFYYFNKTTEAYKKLKKAIELTPSHTKSLMLFGDICFIKGFYKKALNTYLKLRNYAPENFRAIALIANCYFDSKNYNEAIKYSNEAIKIFNNDNFSLLSQIIEIKINSLIKMKLYREAQKTISWAKNISNLSLTEKSYSKKFELLNEKLLLQKKLKFLGIKIV